MLLSALHKFLFEQLRAHQELFPAHHSMYPEILLSSQKLYGQVKIHCCERGRCHTDQNISCLQLSFARRRSFLSMTPTAKPARSYSSSGISPGCSVVSPPINAAPDCTHPSAYATYDLSNLFRIILYHMHIVLQENNGSAPAHAISFTHIATASIPMVSCLSMIMASFTFVPHPSVPDTSVGSSISLNAFMENALRIRRFLPELPVS